MYCDFYKFTIYQLITSSLQKRLVIYVKEVPQTGIYKMASLKETGKHIRSELI